MLTSSGYVYIRPDFISLSDNITKAGLFDYFKVKNKATPNAFYILHEGKYLCCLKHHDGEYGLVFAKQEETVPKNKGFLELIKPVNTPSILTCYIEHKPQLGGDTLLFYTFVDGVEKHFYIALIDGELQLSKHPNITMTLLKTNDDAKVSLCSR